MRLLGLSHSHGARRLIGTWLLTLVSATCLGACGGSPTRPALTPTAQPVALATPLAPAQLPTAASTPAAAPLTLTWWAPDFITTGAGGPGGALLDRQLRDFTAQRAGNVQVNLVTKAKYGKGGLLDLLRSAQPVAPAILPDLVVLDIAELRESAIAGLLQPLEDVLDPALLTNLYPFARQASSYGGHFVALPYIADVEHLAYNRTRVRSAPSTWSDFAANVPMTYLFPIGNAQPPGANSADNMSQAFVSQYLSAGGTIDPETRQLVLNETSLLRTLTFYDQVRTANVLPAGASDGVTLDDCWNAYADEHVVLADVSAHRYLIARDSLKNSGYAALPGWNGPATPVASGWAFAILTNDPARKSSAAQLITWLLTPERLAAWTQATGWLPALPLVWSRWGSNAYYDFLQSQLALAVPGPVGLGDPQTATQLERAVTGVLRDRVSPKDAVRSVATPVPSK
ncbi:MAG TPA: extracellular solute-binding protein [Anaerolineae bacterium]